MSINIRDGITHFPGSSVANKWLFPPSASSVEYTTAGSEILMSLIPFDVSISYYLPLSRVIFAFPSSSVNFGTGLGVGVVFVVFSFNFPLVLQCSVEDHLE